MKLIETLREIKKNNKSIKIKDFIQTIGNEAFFHILFLSTILTSIPAPAWGFGTSTIPGGIITLILAIQIILDYQYVVLPDFIGNIEIKTKYFKEKYLKKMESLTNTLKNYSTKRFSEIFNFNHSNKITGVVLILQAILMLIPIIFTNLFPSLIVTSISYSYLVKDGLLLIIFWAFGVIGFFMYMFFFKYIIRYLKFLSNKFFKTNYNY